MKNIPSHRWSGKQAASSQKQVVYRVKNWAVYNESLVQRGSLTVWLSQEAIDGWRYDGPSQRGAQFLYSDQAIETALTLRKLFGLALRQTEGFVQSLLSMLDLDLSAPNYSTLSRRHPGLQVDLPVKPTNKPRHLVADSTGLKLYGEGEWQVRQQGWTQRRTWRKLHLGFDAHTGEVVAQTLTAAGTDDASQVRPMLEQTPGEIGRFYGDGAYDRWKVHRLLAYPPKPRAAPIEAVIPPPRNATQRIAKRRYRHIEARNERVQSILHMGRKRWKRHRGYHKRSLAETGMARYKRILGPQLAARTWEGQQTEVRIGCSILNRMIHLGKPDSYRVEIMN